jgi:hypothetical protein
MRVINSPPTKKELVDESQQTPGFPMGKFQGNRVGEVY